MDFKRKEQYNIDDLLQIMTLLRKECPWDKVQTHESIRMNFIEEVYEVAEAIDKNDISLMQEELGDVLLQVLFHTEIEREQGHFVFEDVCDGISKKLIERHPHIFESYKANTVDKVLDNWNTIKMQQKGQLSYTDNLKGVTKALPGLMRSEKVQNRAKKAGFDYQHIEQAMADMESELAELKQAIILGENLNIEEELGDLLFSIVNVSRFLKINAEQSLEKATDKFIRRFEKVEHLANQKNIDMKEENMDVLNSLWKEAKQNS